MIDVLLFLVLLALGGYALLALSRIVADSAAPEVVQLADLWAAEDDDDGTEGT